MIANPIGSDPVICVSTFGVEVSTGLPSRASIQSVMLNPAYAWVSAPQEL